MKNVVLIGMPGAGKSTVGVLLAKSLLMDFTDTDLIIQNKCRRALCDIINNEGTDAFIRTEEEIILGEVFCGCVIATGGSAVYGKAAMEKLKRDGIVVYLKVGLPELIRRLGDITTRGIAMKSSETIEDLFNERAPLYEKYADVTIDCNGLTAEECVRSIYERLIDIEI